MVDNSVFVPTDGGGQQTTGSMPNKHVNEVVNLSPH